MPEIIYINGKFLLQQVTGVQRYALELFRYIDSFLQESSYQDLRVVCLVPRGIYTVPNWRNIEVRQVGINTGHLWEQIDLPLYSRGSLLFSPGNTGPLFYANQVITLHDASTFAVPQAYSRIFRAKYKLTFNALVRFSKMRLTDSQFSQRELGRYLGVRPERFRVILLGGDHFTETQADITILNRQGLTPKGYFLSVASQSLHKNFGSILQAASIYPDFDFVAVGGSYSRVFQQVDLQSKLPNVHLLGYVNDHELKALYENALAFIFPSTYEGFGLPVLEAMNSGCPVLCSTSASLSEVGGDAVMYFDPHDTDSIVAVIENFISDSARAADLQIRGYKQARMFSWEKTARITMDALVSCL